MADAKSPAWEKTQIKTFTKWCNNHLKNSFGKDVQIANILEDWANGIRLMQLSVALYSVNDKNPDQALTMPKLRKNELNATSRIAMISNGNKALAMLKKAGVGIRGVSAENLCDFDKRAILGMIWIIILDYAARGFGGSSAEVKRALLEWVNKKTDGYDQVNPPGVKNFGKDWRSGLAWCALLHRHRPHLINYDECVGKSNAENLEKAFTIAEELGIPRLLDVEDVDTDSPDDKSIMTYVMEYFLFFAGDTQKELAAKSLADWLNFVQGLREQMNDYERRAKALVAWKDETISTWTATEIGPSKSDALDAFQALRAFVGEQRPIQEMEKMDVESLFAEIQTTLLKNDLAPYKPPAGLSPDEIQDHFGALSKAQGDHGAKVRAAKFKHIEKKQDTSSDDIKEEVKKSFNNFDKNSNGFLNKEEFIGGCMNMGIALRTTEEKDQLFDSLAENAQISYAAYEGWMMSRMNVTMDSPDSIKAAFKALANGNSVLQQNDLNTPPLTDAHRKFLADQDESQSDGFDYSTFVDRILRG
jgi:Ca2+-binding EF-hand superfamily protein